MFVLIVMMVFLEVGLFVDMGVVVLVNCESVFRVKSREFIIFCGDSVVVIFLNFLIVGLS